MKGIFVKLSLIFIFISSELLEQTCLLTEIDAIYLQIISQSFLFGPKSQLFWLFLVQKDFCVKNRKGCLRFLTPCLMILGLKVHLIFEAMSLSPIAWGRNASETFGLRGCLHCKPLGNLQFLDFTNFSIWWRGKNEFLWK